MASEIFTVPSSYELDANRDRITILVLVKYVQRMWNERNADRSGMPAMGLQYCNMINYIIKIE